jgi:precorrin-2 dehydrogenase / sirohydrochlorin ferrochelatase
MLPVVVDIGRLRVILVGTGKSARRRLALLDEAGAAALLVYADAPSPDLAAAAGPRLVRRLPAMAELVAAQLVFIAADLPAPRRIELAARCRAAGILVHVEDDLRLSDIHAPAVLRRGDLTIAVSTAGVSPGLAVQVKHFLGRVFGPEWQERLETVAGLRRRWREGGADARTVGLRTEQWVGSQGWLPADTATPGGSTLTPAEAVDVLAAGRATRH